MKALVSTALGALTFFGIASRLVTPAYAWGEEGHEIVALVASHYLEAGARQKVDELLAGDQDPLTAHDIASESVWADRYENSDRFTTRERYARTWRWHFVNIEIQDPELDSACFGHPALPQGVPALDGPAKDCIVDKIDEFARELGDASTTADERLIALKFLLHFVGDVHQPLHASDRHDRGGNEVEVETQDLGTASLHGFWDTGFVQELGDNPRRVADSIVATITPEEVTAWSRGSTADWALESFQLARRDAYGRLPAAQHDGVRELPTAYVDQALADVRLQLARAGVRLGFVLNRALGGR